MSSDEDEIPELVPASVKKVPITIITGFLGKISSNPNYHFCTTYLKYSDQIL